MFLHIFRIIYTDFEDSLLYIVINFISPIYDRNILILSIKKVFKVISTVLEIEFRNQTNSRRNYSNDFNINFLKKEHFRYFLRSEGNSSIIAEHLRKICLRMLECCRELCQVYVQKFFN